MRKQPKRRPRKPEPEFKKHVTVTVTPPTGEEKEPHCTVSPGVFWVRHGGTVSFEFKFGPLTLFIPTPRRAPKPFQWLRGPLAALPGGKKAKRLKVTGGCGVHEYPYALYCHEFNCFAEGSTPRMIVGP
jgi:hypothetical protein